MRYIFYQSEYRSYQNTYFFIVFQIVNSGTLWLLNYQSQEGYFTEAENGTIHQAYHVNNPKNEKSHILLTAHVLIAIEEVMQNLQGNQRLHAATAKQRGLTYLEKCLPEISDEYELSIVTYALALMKSPQSDIAFGQLMAKFREEDGKVYWSPTPINANR